MTSWGATKAKAQFSAVLDKADIEGPQLVQRRKQRYILLTEEQFNSHQAIPSKPEEKPFTSAWDAIRPPEKDLFDYDVPGMCWKPRKVDL